MASSIANVVFPGQFNPKSDNWREYKELFLCALDASGHDDTNSSKARSLFLSQCGKETYALIASFLVPLRPTEVSLTHIFGILDKFYEPEVNEILRAGKFHNRCQEKGESMQDFVAAISSLGAKCKYTDLKRQLRDRLVLGVRDQRLRREMLKTKDLTYETALQICLNYQSSFPDLYPNELAESSQTQTTTIEPMDVNMVQYRGCKHCGKNHAIGHVCHFTKARCFYCKKIGHTVAVCKKNSKVHNIRESMENRKIIEEKPEEMLGIYSVNHVNGYQPPIKAEVWMDGALVVMEVDSGAARTIISEETYKKLWETPPVLTPSHIKLVTVTREELKVVGVTKVHVKLTDKKVVCELLVVAGKTPNLLGRNWFNALGISVSGLCWAEDKMAVLVEEFPEVFRQGLGTYKGPEVSLHVRPDATPQFFKARPIPFPLQKEVNKELNQMVKEGILTPVKYSKWATPIRIVKKDDGSLRVCGDYRATVNIAIDIDRYPLPTSAEAFVKLSGGQIFTKLDLKQAYTQLKVDSNTAELLTLNTPLGLMKMNRLAFGVNAAPAIFQRIMSNALAGMEGVACLLDDIAVTGINEQQHNERLRKVLGKLNELGLRLNMKKCIFASKGITFLGHRIDQEGLHPSAEKVREIKEKSAPNNKQSLRAFLGLYNFYEKFLPDKATILEPLYRLLDSKKAWSWTNVEQAAFERAKDLISSDLTLIGYDLNKPLLLICDSSEYGLGAVIVHIMEDSSERPIMMTSRTLQPHERRYGQIDKEALAIMFGLAKFHDFLMGRKFCIITDHKPLVGLFSPTKPIPDQISPRMLRWSLKLSCYNYTIKYRTGKLIGNADALSRWMTPSSSDVGERPLREVLLLEEMPVGWFLDSTKIASETKKDPLLQKVIFYVLHGWPKHNRDVSLQPFWNRRGALSLSKDCLLWSNRVVVPSALQGQVLKLLHAPHVGIVQTKAYARGYVWWAGLDKDIEALVAECEKCQLVRNNPSKDPQVWIPSAKPWSRLHVDFAGPFQGKTFLVVIDSYSKWIEVEIVSSMNSSVAINILRKIFCSQGLPEVIVSDNGKTFISSDFEQFLKKNGIRHILSPPYHPATNGQVERVIQTFKNHLRKWQEVHIPWNEKLAKILFYMRTGPNSCTNKTPAEILNGRKFRTALSLVHPHCSPTKKEVQEESALLHPPKRAFKLRQPVLMRMYGSGDKWLRATVEKIEGPSTYSVRSEDGVLYRRHMDQLLARRVVEDNDMDIGISGDRPYDVEGEESEESPQVLPIPDKELWPDVIGIPK